MACEINLTLNNKGNKALVEIDTVSISYRGVYKKEQGPWILIEKSLKTQDEPHLVVPGFSQSRVAFWG